MVVARPPPDRRASRRACCCGRALAQLRSSSASPSRWPRSPRGLRRPSPPSLALGARSLARPRRDRAAARCGRDARRDDVVCTDKTGTLTENRIRVAALRPAAGVDELRLLEAAVLASTARATDDGQVLGDPDRGRAVLAAMERGLAPGEILGGRAPVYEVPFDSERKLMTVVYDGVDGRIAFSQGRARDGRRRAPSHRSRSCVTLAGAWAAEGFRVLAIASRRSRRRSQLDDSVEAKLELLGPDRPPRPPAADGGGARSARPHEAGIDVRMLTGDHPATARTIGHALGLAEARYLRPRHSRLEARSGRGSPGAGRGCRRHGRRRQRCACAAPCGRRRRDGAVRHGGCARGSRDRAHRRRLRHDRRRNPRRPPDRRQHPQVRRLPALGEPRRGTRLRGCGHRRAGTRRSR